MTQQLEIDGWHMRRALELAALGQGHVEPNPMVGCVLARGAEIVAEGWHRRYGGPHAEVEALRQAGARAAGTTAYVTLEPCCHHGKTPPCSEALIRAGVARVVCAQRDPFPQVAGGGIRALEAAGIPVATGVLEAEARWLNAPYLTLVEQRRPWIIAKWAMTLDGKIATRSGDSRWISGEESRAWVHQLRGRMDGILVGSGTARADDPQLTVRLADGTAPPRIPLRIVLDSRATLASESQLVRTARETPLLVVVTNAAAAAEVARLTEAGCEVFFAEGETPAERLTFLLKELGRRRLTNVLIEGGGRVLGTALEADLIDEVHAFVAPKFVGGADAPGPLAGQGVAKMAEAIQLVNPQSATLGSDLHIWGRIAR